MSSYDFQRYVDDVVITPETDPDPDRTFLGLLRRELMTAAEREGSARAALAEHQAKADACTREREAIERAIKAYEGGFK
jgi:hypothetical protein